LQPVNIAWRANAVEIEIGWFKRDIIVSNDRSCLITPPLSPSNRSAASALEEVIMTTTLCRIGVVLVTSLGLAYDCFALDPWQECLSRADARAASGDFEAAASIAYEALRLVQGAPSPCDTCAARVYNSLGRYYFTSDPSAAESCYVKALELREHSQGSMSPDVAVCQSNLGRVLVKQGRYPEAQALFKKALAIQKRNFGPVHRDVARTSNSLGDLCRRTGDYHESERYFQDGVVACRGWAGSDTVAAMICNNLGILYQEEGRRFEAEQQYLRVVDLYDSASCREPLKLATAIDNLARLWHESGRYADAERLYAQALGIFETYAGPGSPDVARSLNNIAFLWKQTGEYDRADQALRRAIAVQEAVFGSRHPAVAASLNNLAYVQIARGNMAEADALMQRAIAINEAAGPAQAKSLAENLVGMSEIKLAEHDNARACRFAGRAFELRRSLFRHAVTTFIERVAILNSLQLKRDAAFYMSVLLDSPHGAEVNAEAIAGVVLNTKGMITDVMAARTWAVMNSVHITACKDSLDAISIAAQDLRRETTSANSAAVARLQLERDRLEGEIASRQASLSEHREVGDVSADGVSAALPAGYVLVEYVKYDHRFGPTATEPRYLACLFAAGRSVRVVSLGPANPIDSLVARYREYFLSPRTRKAADYERISSELVRLIWLPFAPLLSGNLTVILAPDGDLNLISFAGLRDVAGRYLIEDYSIHYCGSGRDLLRHPGDTEAGYGLLAMGDPAFGGSAWAEDNPAETSIGGRLLAWLRNTFSDAAAAPQRAPLPRLPGTRQEVTAICSLWQSASVEPLMSCYGLDASEYAFRHYAGGKRIVYVATHGYSLRDSIAAQPDVHVWNGDDPCYVGSNPLALSGLVLAPGQTGLGKPEARANSSERDGLLSAEDIAALDLMSADLVVLSACETGLGTVISGEGVYGLRRATLIAGARSVISTLWSVDDQSTAALMSRFFARRGDNIPEMLRAVQLEQLRAVQASGKLDDPFTWAPFVVAGAWDWR
jgi:CHAT domain-containing protein/tetratricopeptide (TPR) repeat protein